ncbi:hypothetical protein D3C87_1773660 [compost metagenome]
MLRLQRVVDVVTTNRLVEGQAVGGDGTVNEIGLDLGIGDQAPLPDLRRLSAILGCHLHHILVSRSIADHRAGS